MHTVREDLMDVRESKYGRGIFAREFIPAGTVLYTIKGESLDFNATKKLGEKESHSLQIGIDDYIICETPFLYSNHSCNPNCAVTTNMEFIALENIQPGEEMFWDYSTSMLERSWTMKCLCGEKNCRKIVKDFDLLPHEIQLRYLQLNMVLPFIVHAIRQQLAKTA
jgi:hypothetical protein